jgi:glyoxylase-like metal-dependent hydrolase (beta-lactamase superfamily II)
VSAEESAVVAQHPMIGERVVSRIEYLRSFAPIVRAAHAGVSSYHVTGGDGFVLIDTGKPEKRREFEAELARAGCKSGDLKLIALTHGDYDHAGNAAYLTCTPEIAPP